MGMMVTVREWKLSHVHAPRSDALTGKSNFISQMFPENWLPWSRTVVSGSDLNAGE